MEETSLVLRGQGQIERQDPEIAAAAAREKSHIQAAFEMAVYRPRDIELFRVKLLANCKRPRFAELVEYSKPIGGKPIKGLSVRLADTALQLYGNMQCDSRVIYDDPVNRRLKVEVTDYETNVTKSSDIPIKKEVERKSSKGREVISERKNSYGETTYLVIATEDEVLVKQASLVAKARRDLILSMIPRDILDDARDEAAITLANEDSKDPQEAKRKLVDAFVVLNISPKQLAEYLGHTVDEIDKTELADLRKIYAAINSGEARWSDFTQKDEDGESKKAASKSPFEKPKKDDIVVDPEPMSGKADILKHLTAKGLTYEDLDAWLRSQYPNAPMGDLLENAVYLKRVSDNLTQFVNKTLEAKKK